MRTTIPLLLLILVSPSTMAAGGSSTGGGISAPAPRVEKTPEQKAADRYNAGLKSRDKANKLWQQAQSNEGRKRDKRLAKAQKHYRKAVTHFQAAIGYRADFYQAHSSLGYAHRRLGEFDQSLAAYNRALSINPAYGEAIEYRAEAYLGLGRLGEARDAYLDLFARDRSLADQLLLAMDSWVVARRQDPGELSGAEIEAFADWVQERREIASRTADLGQPAERSW